METLQLDKQKIEKYLTLSLQEYHELYEFLSDAEAIMGVFTLFDEETIKPFELAFLKRLADYGLECLMLAFTIINKE